MFFQNLQYTYSQIFKIVCGSGTTTRTKKNKLLQEMFIVYPKLKVGLKMEKNMVWYTIVAKKG